MAVPRLLNAGNAGLNAVNANADSFCNYSHRVCMQNRLENYEYCIRHILEDKNSPYKQCNFTSSKTGKRCSNAAPKLDKKDGFCLEHTQKAFQLRQKAAHKRRATESTDLILDHLDVYRRQGQQGQLTAPNGSAGLSSSSWVTSDSESEGETTLVEQAWRGDSIDSDAEDSLDSDEDPLRHAGTYTVEEVALVTRDKLIRLQSLYIDQFKRLQHVLKEKRRKFLAISKMEEQTIGKSLGRAGSQKDLKRLKKLRALNRYRKHCGVESLLHHESKERRKRSMAGSGASATTSSDSAKQHHHHPRHHHHHHHHQQQQPHQPHQHHHPACSHAKCGHAVLPFTKYCLQHIMDDSYQVLYQPCHKCAQPLMTLDDLEAEQPPTCPHHSSLAAAAPAWNSLATTLDFDLLQEQDAMESEEEEETSNSDSEDQPLSLLATATNHKFLQQGIITGGSSQLPQPEHQHQEKHKKENHKEQLERLEQEIKRQQLQRRQFHQKKQHHQHHHKQPPQPPTPSLAAALSSSKLSKGSSAAAAAAVVGGQRKTKSQLSKAGQQHLKHTPVGVIGHRAAGVVGQGIKLQEEDSQAAEFVKKFLEKQQMWAEKQKQAAQTKKQQQQQQQVGSSSSSSSSSSNPQSISSTLVSPNPGPIPKILPEKKAETTSKDSSSHTVISDNDSSHKNV